MLKNSKTLITIGPGNKIYNYQPIIEIQKFRKIFTPRKLETFPIKDTYTLKSIQ